MFFTLIYFEASKFYEEKTSTNRKLLKNRQGKSPTRRAAGPLATSSPTISRSLDDMTEPRRFSVGTCRGKGKNVSTVKSWPIGPGRTEISCVSLNCAQLRPEHGIIKV